MGGFRARHQTGSCLNWPYEATPSFLARWTFHHSRRLGSFPSLEPVFERTRRDKETEHHSLHGR